MKQYITEEQLEELSEKGKKRLLRWYKPSIGDSYFVVWFGSKVENYTAESLKELGRNDGLYIKWPLLSVGQMIKFLGWDDMEIHKGSPPTYYMRKKYPDRVNQRWFVQDGDYENAGKCFEGFSICDALWQAVKDVLER